MRIKDEGKLTRDELYPLIKESPELTAALTTQATAVGLSADKASILKVALGGTRTEHETGHCIVG